MAVTKAAAEKLVDKLQDVLYTLKLKANEVDDQEMRPAEVKRHKKWLEEAWGYYKTTYAAVCETPYKLDPELPKIEADAKATYNKIQGILDEFGRVTSKGAEIPSHSGSSSPGAKQLTAEKADDIDSSKAKKNAEAPSHSGPVFSGAGQLAAEKADDLNSIRLNELRAGNDGQTEEVKVFRRKEPNTMAEKLTKRFQQRVVQLEEKIEKVRGRLPEATKGLLDISRSSVETQYKDILSIYDKVCDGNFDDDDIDEAFNQLRTSYEDIMEEIAIRYDGANNMERYTSTRLEELKVPNFNGNVDEWNSFQEIFTQLVEKKKTLHDVEKFYRLKSAVKGEAARLIQHLQVTGENYKAAWEILEQRYSNRRLLFCTLFDRIIDYGSINTQNAASIKQLLDTATESYQALKAMGISMDNVDPFIARILIRKLDKEGLLRYEQCVQRTKYIQRLQDVMAFLEQQYLALEAVNIKSGGGANQKTKSSQVFQTSQRTCMYCSTPGHVVIDCRKLSQLPVGERYSWVSKAKICKVCLSHRTDKRCFKFNTKCERCGGRHHLLLHANETKAKPQETQRASSRTQLTTENNAVTLLATAQVRVKSAGGEMILMRALIDQGSQRTSISEEAAQTLRLPRKKMFTKLVGLGNTTVGVSKSAVQIEIKPRFQSDVMYVANAMVLSKLSSAQPDRNLDIDVCKWKNYCLADPLFHKSDRIDLLIGADLYHEIIQGGIVKIDSISGQETSLGLILCGSVDGHASRNVVMAVTKELEKFWEMEEVQDDEGATKNEERCEQLFTTTTSLNEENRFVVRLPFKNEKELGDSKKMAMARLISLEKKFQRDEELKKEYVAFMKEYLKMGHMRKVSSNMMGKYYLPHQAVIRENHLTTKVRVVFDASAKTTNGSSLNDVLEIGPKLQRDIFQILVKWRFWRYVVAADVEKMYRQVLVAEEDQPYQTILWRENPRRPVEEFMLTTVTYGTACAPFLAKRTLLETANDCCTEDPKLHNIIKDDFYMDDLMTGADSTQECIEIQTRVTSQLDKFGFKLRKWMSNDEDILSEIPDVGDNNVVRIEEGEMMKTLGVQWDPHSDSFAFYFQTFDDKELTKRKVLSKLAKIYDPLGWLAPITILAKLFIQKLWLMDLQWDVQLKAELTKEWNAIMAKLAAITSVKIPRWLSTSYSTNFELHGFADASEKAYAAVIYTKTSHTVTLLAAKSKVNPMKNKKTLPKLELCAAHLLAKLLRSVVKLIDQHPKIYAWSDSMIALSWIANSDKVKDKFIRVRVREIREAIPLVTWKHVRSKDNPADAASRGLKPEQLVSHQLWWSGPHWLKENSAWPVDNFVTFCGATRAVKGEDNIIAKLISRIFGYRKLIRIVAYVRRFIKKTQKKTVASYLTVDDQEEAERIVLKTVQGELFSAEIACLITNNEIPTRNRICGLNPFVDKYGILRVGGRLENAQVSYDRKHPIILGKCHLVQQIIDEVHRTTLHGGAKVMENMLRRKFWVIRAKNALKKAVRCCVKCIRYRREVAGQLMGNLPTSRVSASHPFEHTGIDYAGPIQMRMSRGRGQNSYKGYIAVFICMSTKAVHLEAVSDLTTDAFMAALRRFFSRRGKSAHMYSDNGTNFVGAARKLDKEYYKSLQQNTTIVEVLASERVQWHFIPPGAPHFGGLWEAAVKSMKHHLRRVVGESRLTYEEMATLLAQIEAVLNSRPLCEIGEDADNGDVLTPGHFLIGRSLLDVSEANNGKSIGSLDRWKLIQKMRNEFWSQWRNDYLSSLQQRAKWKLPLRNLNVGQLVLIKDESAPPAKWPMGKIIELHEGKDDRVRVVTLKTQDGILKRPIHKLCPLDVVKDKNKKADEEVTAKSYVTRISTRNTEAKWNIGMVLLIILLIMTNSVRGLSSKKRGATVRELGDRTVMYMDKIGTMNRITSSWNLVTYYNMEPYFKTVSHLEDMLQKCQHLCPMLKQFERQCISVLNSMSDRLNNVYENDKLFTQQERGRNKRAPFEFVGSFYHILFGVMDADDRANIEDNMKNLLENQHNLKYLAEKQTSVVESTMNILKKTTDEVNIQFKDIREKVYNMTELLNTDYYVYKESINFFMMTGQLGNLIDETEKVQTQVVGLLMDINHGKINPNLIRPSKLQPEIYKVKEQLPSQLRLPGKSKEAELQTIYRLMSARGILVGEKLVINIQIPLLERQSSDIFNIIPLPITANGSKMVAVLRQQFLVYNYGMDSYHLITQPQLNQCQKNGEDEYLCKGNWAWEDANDNSCELASLKPSNKYDCYFAPVNSKDVWMELHTQGSWLFRTYDRSAAHVLCSSKTQEIYELPLQGVLVLEAGCAARIGRTILSAPQDVRSELQAGFTPYFFKEINNISMIEQSHFANIDHATEIKKLHEEIRMMKKDSIHLKGLNWHYVSGHVSLIIISILLLIGASYTACKCIGRNKSMIVVRRPQNVQI